MPTKLTKYYWEHREQCLETTRLYAAKHRDKILEQQKEYYQKVLKCRRRIDRLYAAADKPPKEPKAPKPKKTIKYFGPPIDLPVKPVELPEPKGGLTFQPGGTIDWS